ncbi:unnamed protein product [Medioppia subpectinata]|uniref:Uncharacterized protein n=1 Tax=Medioppia subpectinata TaxID=1979941 RepID=A0A7R9KU29_9ACAR|nr:unnamed protein product [Medioppia subpectinata]CAG2109851.1 unnamed protein product [Medioppia subpectinata]
MSAGFGELYGNPGSDTTTRTANYNYFSTKFRKLLRVTNDSFDAKKRLAFEMFIDSSTLPKGYDFALDSESALWVSSSQSSHLRDYHFPMCFLYNMSKSAVDMFTRCMALELGPKGIRVNSVNPAAVNTNIAIAMGLSRPLIDQMFADQEKSIPLQRQGTPTDVANAVLFLASDKCSFVNGSNFFVDGGDAGKVVVITGSSSGIGAAAALQFSKSGAQVVVTGRNAQNVSEVAKECQKISPKGLKALEVVMDVSKDEDCKRLIDSTIKSFGKLDILVNNAAKGGFKSISDPNIMDEFQAVMDTNLRSVVYLTHLSVEHLEKTKGNIINVSAVAGIRPSALDMFSRCLALELGPKGIRVNVVNPGAVRTNFGTAAGLSKPQFEFILNALGKSYPLGRVGESIDIANVILFLASDESSFVTGINFVSDGGSLYAPTAVVVITGSSSGIGAVTAVEFSKSGAQVVITGRNAQNFGIGAVTAVEFSKSGAQVVITGRNAQNLSEVAKDCQKVSPKGLKPLEVLADISKDDDCKRLIDSTIKSFRKLDILVNNAGSGNVTTLTDTNVMEKYDNLMNTNLRSVVYLTHLSVEHLEKTKGNIINISSTAAHKPNGPMFGYCMSKCALNMFTKCLALELGPKGIRVNVISPGAVRTNFGPAMGTSKEHYELLLEDRAKTYPLRKVGESIDIANMIVFLASNECSFVTGTDVMVDGGGLHAPKSAFSYRNK